MSRYRRWVQTDASGRITRERLTASQLDPPWMPLSQDQADATMAEPRAFRMRADGVLERLPRVRLGGTRRFRADGQATGALMVKRFPEGIAEIEVEVNGRKVMMRERVAYQLGPVQEPGFWRARVTDSRVVADPEEYQVEAERPRQEV